jgi:O-antigen/teichoic acid export membrane protein
MLKNLLNTFAARAISSGVSFLLLILTTQYLGAFGRGLISLVTASISIILLFNGFVGGTALVYLLPQNKTRAFLSHTFKLSYSWSVLVCVTLTAFFYVTGSLPREFILHVFALSLMASLFTSNALILLAHERIVLYNLAILLQIVLNFIGFAFVVFVLRSPSVQAYIFTLYLSYTLGLAFTVFHVVKIWLSTEPSNSSLGFWQVLKNIMQYGLVSQLANVMQYLNYKLSYYVMNHYGGPEDVGLYHVGITLSESVWMLSNSISLVLYAKIANLGDTPYSRDLTIKLAKFSFIATLLCIIILLLIPVSLITFIFGKDFGQVHSIMITLSPGVVVFGLSVIISHYFAGTGRYHINTLASLLGLILTVGGNFLLVPRFGYLGAGATGSISFMATALFSMIVFFRVAKVRLSAFKLSKAELQSVVKLLISRGGKLER